MKPKTVKLRITRSEEDTKPFIVAHEKLNDPYKELDKEDGFDPLSSKVPVNKEFIELGDQLREALPSLMKKKVLGMRNFFLKELAPILLASSNGLMDANEILKNALDEDPETKPYFNRLEAMLNVALEVRMLDFVSDFAGLNSSQRQMLTYLLFSKEGSNGSIASVVSKMFEVPNVPGSRKGSEVQVRPVPEAQGDRINPRARRAGRSPRR